VGSSSASILRSSTAGEVAELGITFSSNLGGIVGFQRGGILLKDSFTTARVTGDDTVGGVVGYNRGSIVNTFSTGVVLGSKNTGAIVGDSEGTVTNSFGRNAAGAYTQSTYGTKSGGSWSGFDFDDTWTMVDGETRPFLRSERNTRITTGRQLQLMDEAPGADYTLAKDLDVSTPLRANKGLWRAGFVPVGNTSADGAFTGFLNGNSKKITGLFVNRDEDLTDGLLGDVNGGSVSGLTLENADLTAGDGQNGDDGTITIGNGVALTGTVNLDAGTGDVSVAEAIGSGANPATSVSISGTDLSLPAVTTSSSQTYHATGTITATGDLLSQGGSSEIRANQVQVSPDQALSIEMGSLTLDTPLQQLGSGGLSIAADAVTFPDTIETRGGAITLTAGDGGITAEDDGDGSPAILRTRASADSGTASGAILLDAENANDNGFIAVGNLDAAGADHAAGAGSHGGDITLKSDGGMTYTALSVGGGDGSGASGGNSGDIFLQTDDNAGLSLPPVPLRALGGSGSTAGSDGIITLEARGNGGITQPADGAEIQGQRLNLASHTISSPLTSLTGEIALVDADNKVDVLGVNTSKGTADATGQTLRFVNQGDLALKGWRSSGFYAEGPLEIDVGSGHLTLDAAIQSPVGGLTATGGKFTATSNGTIDYSATSAVDLDFSERVDIDAPIETGGGDLSIAGSQTLIRYDDGNDVILTSGGNVKLRSHGQRLELRGRVRTEGGNFDARGNSIDLQSPMDVVVNTDGGDVTLNAGWDGGVVISENIETNGGNFTSSGKKFQLWQTAGGTASVYTQGGDINLNGHRGLISGKDFYPRSPGFFTGGGDFSAKDAQNFGAERISTNGGLVDIKSREILYVRQLRSSGGDVRLDAGSYNKIHQIDTEATNGGGKVELMGPVRFEYPAHFTDPMSITTGPAGGALSSTGHCVEAN